MNGSVLLVRLLAIALALAPAAAALAASPPPPPVSYAPPAGKLPAGHLHGQTFDAVLPSGRLVTPAGTSAVTGIDAQGVALSPDGRFAIVDNTDPGATAAVSSVDPAATAGSSLVVFEAGTLTPVARFHAPAGEAYGGGILAVTDPAQPSRTLVVVAGGASDAVYCFTLDARGQLTPDARHRIAIPGPLDVAFADFGRSGPAALTVSTDGRRAYVVDAAGGSIATVDLGSRRLVGAPRPVGFFPHAAAVAGSRLLVTNEGMMRYALAAARTTLPPFGAPAPALDRASSLSLLDLNAAGVPLAPGPATGGDGSVPMDPPVDGLRVVGGAHPTAIAVTPDARAAFVAMTDVDRVATVDLDGTPHVAGGTELRLFDRGPYGTQPTALVLSRDGTRLYVALRGLDAIAVIDARDPQHLHRLGLIPTGWAPTALALAPDDRTLFVVDQRGFGADGGVDWSTIQRVDLAAVRLVDSTRATLAATRTIVPPAVRYPKAIKNVVLIVVDGRSFDAIYGDLGDGLGRGFLRAGAATTPNLHALAQRFALATNFYAEAPDPAIAHHVLVAGMATPFAETRDDPRDPLFAGSDDPEDAPRIGTVFEALARRGISFRDYGGFLRVAGFEAGSYGFDVPAAAALAGHVDPDYPGPDDAVPDVRRAQAFARDYDAAIASAATPRFAYVWLPGTQPADTDLAVGQIVEHLSHLITWRTTAAFVVSADAGTTGDHVDGSRAFALVVSPYAKRHAADPRHLSTASVLKTIDGIFDLPPLSLGDLLAGDMSDCFTVTADARPFVALHPVQP